MPEPARPAPPRRPPGTLRVGRIAGSDVLVSSSWFVVAGLIAVVVAPAAEQVQPGIGNGKYVAGLAFAVVMYLSVLLHEASHAVAARRYGLEVESITLHFLGGMTSIRGEARRPGQEAVIAVVGPLTSLVVGGAALALYFVVPAGLLQLTLAGLASVNLLVGLLNLVPGLPLDGGRVLKALVWRVSGDVHRGTVTAAWGGRVAALLALGYPAVMSLTGAEPDLLDYLLAGVVAVFLWSGATAALTSARLRRRFSHLVARDLARRTLAVPDDLPLAEAIRRAQEAEAGSLVTVSPDGRPLGVVSESALLAVPDDRRPWVPVSSVARTLREGLSLPADITGDDLVTALGRTPAHEYLLVEDDGRIYGVLTTTDVDRAFRTS